MAVDETKILVPLDGSELAERALIMLTQLGLKPMHVRLISVVTAAARLESPDEAEQLVCDNDVSHAYLQSVITRLASNPDICTLESVVRSGDPASTILEEVIELKADLLVLSSHGRSGFQRLRLGSVSDILIRNAICSTLVVGPRVQAFGAARRLLVPLDGSDTAAAALPQAVRLARMTGSILKLARVVPIPAAGTELGNAAITEAQEEEAGDYLRRVAASVGKGVKVDAEVLEGFADQELVRYAGEQDVDLVIMTSHGRSGWKRAALGSVTDRMVAASSTPVMIVPVPSQAV
jgi:nucleotide-binding universal stress UspA family protein